jgi:hypothetical protein
MWDVTAPFLVEATHCTSDFVFSGDVCSNAEHTVVKAMNDFHNAHNNQPTS